MPMPRHEHNGAHPSPASASSELFDTNWSPRRIRAHAVSLLDEDRELAAELGCEQQDRARVASRTRVRRLDRGAWDPHSDTHDRAGMGLLVLDGLLLRRVTRGGRCAAELLGPGDLVNPVGVDEFASMLEFGVAWRVLLTSRVATLDHDWVARMAPYPEVIGALTTRGLQRALRLTQLLTIAQEPRLCQRLQVLLWFLSERFGTVHRDGVHLSLPLTHDALAQLACARRPSVSSALTRLQRDGRIRREAHGWLLRPPAPSDSRRVTGTEPSVADGEAEVELIIGS